MATQGVPLWSTTAATNNTADPAVNWQEGQAPSSVNDSSRAMMASLAKWRDDLYGLTTGGTSTAFTVTTNATYATAAAMSGAVFTIIPNATSGATPTLAVDGLTARALNISTGVAIPTGALKSGTPYLIKYVHATTEFIVLGALSSLSLPGNLVVTGTANVTGVTTLNDASIAKTLTLKDGGDLASATSLTLGDGNFYNITGTTATTSIGTKGIGTVVKFRANAAWPITHHASNLILLTGASITCAAGDMMEFEEYASAQWRMTAFHRASGYPLSGSAASTAAVTAETAEATFIQPDRLVYSKRVAKAWAKITWSAGTPSLTNGVGFSSTIADNGAGDLTLNFSATQTNANFAVVATPLLSGTSVGAYVNSTSTTQIRIVVAATATGTGTDPTSLSVVVFGDI